MPQRYRSHGRQANCRGDHIALPPQVDSTKVEAIYEGINALAKKYEVAIVGGETTTNPERIWISVALVGTVPRGKAVRRSGAQVGDAIFVSGQLGGSLNGRHLAFEPRILEAQWLTEKFQVHAMLDLSDGLAGDLRHILRGSKVGAELFSPAIPISSRSKTRRPSGVLSQTAIAGSVD